MRISEISEYSQGVATDGASAVEVSTNVVPQALRVVPTSQVQAQTRTCA